MKDNAILDCHVRGVQKPLALSEAVQAFWTSTYGWALPIDIYRWDVDGHDGSDYFPGLVELNPRRFGLHLHTSSTHTLTIDTMIELKKKAITKNLFQSYAARFNKIFGDLPVDLRPFLYYEIDEIGRPPVPAYRMRSSRSWIVVKGVTAGQGFGDDYVDWSCFQNPPTPDASK